MNFPEMLNILSACGIGAVAVTEDGIIHMANKCAARLLHETEERPLSGMSLAELAPELLENTEKPAYASVCFGEYLLRVPVPEIPGTPEGIRLVTFRDATAEVQRHLYEHVLEQTTDCVIICDEKTRILFLNNAAVKMDGLTLNDVIG